jgi:DNA polymerase III subunit epsilon
MDMATTLHRPMVFLDIETTGGSPYDSRITEIGALRVEGGKVVERYSQLINPEQNVPWFITKLTGITDDMLWDQPTFAGLAHDLDYFLRDAIFIAHNVSFDYGFIKEAFRRQGMAYNVDRFCTARLSRRLYPEQRRHNLDTVIAAHNITVKNRHRAFDDAAVLYEFYQKAIDQHGLKVFAAIDKIMVHTNKLAA